ncbi:MAG: hypothetical protein FRX49_08388 [Trebouxia sp. A1-2]|nr:MAG: hypothetical protein FRX49_08388 [Trebouxia sp. A1-2]
MLNCPSPDLRDTQAEIHQISTTDGKCGTGTRVETTLGSQMTLELNIGTGGEAGTVVGSGTGVRVRGVRECRSLRELLLACFIAADHQLQTPITSDQGTRHITSGITADDHDDDDMQAADGKSHSNPTEVKH